LAPSPRPPSWSQLVLVVAGIGAGVYFGVSGSGRDLALKANDNRSFSLLGATSGIKSGDRVNLSDPQPQSDLALAG
jgi:hypothetical protein